MRSWPSSRRCALLIVMISPVLLGSQFKCVAVSNPGGTALNPSATTARIDRLEPSTPRVGEVIQATGSGTGTPPLQFAWDFGDGTLTPGMQAAHVYLSAGSYRVTLTVRDALGNMARDSSQVAVSARIPSSVASLVLVSDTVAVAGQPVLFATSALDVNTGALTYIWTFSDGQSATGREAVAMFPVAGVYVASVSVTNDLGSTAVAQIAFEVMQPAH